MKKYIIILSVIVITVVGIIAITAHTDNNKQEDTLKTIRVNEVTRSVFYAPQYIAISQGFFEEEGLEIEITTGQGADKVMTAVLSGQSDIGFAGPEAAIYVYNEGKEDYPEVFAQLTKKDGSLLLGKSEEKDFKWSDLKGKTVIPGRKGGVPNMALQYVIRKNGLDPNTDMVFDDSIKYELMAGAFTGGVADYVTLFEPTASMTELAGKGYIVASVGEAAGDIPYTAYFANKSYIEENSDIIQKFTNAIYKGQKWMENHTDREVAEAVKGFFPDSDVDLLEIVVKRYREIDVWKDTPVLEEKDFELLQTVMTDAGELNKKAPYNKIVNNDFARKAIK